MLLFGRSFRYFSIRFQHQRFGRVEPTCVFAHVVQFWSVKIIFPDAKMHQHSTFQQNYQPNNPNRENCSIIAALVGSSKEGKKDNKILLLFTFARWTDNIIIRKREEINTESQ